jgi:hypothetical protein
MGNIGQDLSNQELREMYAQAVGVIAEVSDEKNQAYKERNMLVRFLTFLFPSYLMPHPPIDKEWDRKWMNIVTIDGPTGQMCWHIHDDELGLFAHLETKGNNWDGHTTAEKYQRLMELGAFEWKLQGKQSFSFDPEDWTGTTWSLKED